MSAVLKLLLALVLMAGGAGAAALTVHTDRWETQRIEDERHNLAVAELADARADAVTGRVSLMSTASDARDLADSLKMLIDLAPGWADPATWSALVTAVDRLRNELALTAVPVIPVVDFDGESSSPATVADRVAALGRLELQTSGSAERLEALVSEVLAARDDLARSAVKAGASLSSFSLPSEEVRDAAREQLATLADSVRAGRDPVDGLMEYTHAWQALKDAHVAAEAARAAAAAAAAAASSSGGSSSAPSFDPLEGIDLSEPTVYLEGAYTPGCGQGDFEWFQLPGGSVWEFYSDDPYDAVLLNPGGIFWHLRVGYC